MAKTHGHGNPRWTREEVILALNLYLDCGGIVPSKSDARIIELSTILRQLPAHAISSRRSTFRNTEGVAFKLQNIRQIATGKGLGNVSSVDKAVWNELGKNQPEVKRIAGVIRKAIVLAESALDEIDEMEFVEGMSATQMHKRRERNSKIRSAVIANRMNKSGVLSCEICELNVIGMEEKLADSVFEAHHIVPLSSAQGKVATRIKDMALLCANCHRLLHRIISVRKSWIGIAEARAIWRDQFRSK